MEQSKFNQLMEHTRAFTDVNPHFITSLTCDQAIQYVSKLLKEAKPLYQERKRQARSIGRASKRVSVRFSIWRCSFNLSDGWW